MGNAISAGSETASAAVEGILALLLTVLSVVTLLDLILVGFFYYF